MALISTAQINGDQLAAAVQLYSSGASFSGNLTSYLAASGWVGPLAVTITGAQDITGQKRFLDSPIVPYSGSSGSAPSARWVNDQITAGYTSLLAIDAATSGYALGISGALSAVRVTGSNVITNANLTGYGGTLVFQSGGFVFISGGAGGGGGGGGGGTEISVEGTGPYSALDVVGVGSVTVLDEFAGMGFLVISGSEIGGGSAAVGDWNAVYTTGNQTINDHKIFTGSPWVATPTAPSGAANLLWTSGVSGQLYDRMTGISGAIVAGNITINNYWITGTGVVAASSTGNVTNIFNITSGDASVSSSGTVNNTFNGTVNSTININQPTGNFVNMSFYFDEYNLVTGLNLLECFVGRDFTFTGFALGLINTGTAGGFLTGSLYQRTSTNTKTAFVDFSINSGSYFSALGGFGQVISGMNRVGIDIYQIVTGMTGLSVGAFGVGY